MVKTRRSNGEAGEVDEGNDTINDVGSVSDEKPNWSQRELRSSQYKVTRKIQHWPNKYHQRRRRAIKMSRIVFPESDTEPEKYSKRSRQVRVFFAEDNDSTNRSVKISRGPRKNYMEDNEDKPIQQNVRRSCRKRKLLHHNFNESWITNELKVKGYPDLYGFPGSSSSDEFSSGDENSRGKKIGRGGRSAAPLPNTDEDTQLSRTRRTSARFNAKKPLNVGTETDTDEDNNQTVIEKKPVQKKDEKMDMEVVNEDIKEEVKEETEKPVPEDSESNQTPAKTARGRRPRRRPKKDDSQETPSSSSSECGSSLPARRPRRSGRTRAPDPAFVQIAPRQTRPRAKTFTLTRKKPQYSLRERKPKILRRKTIRSQSPSSSSSSSSSSDTEEDLNVSVKNKTKGRQKSKSNDDKKTDRALRDIQPIELDGSVRFSSVGGLEEHIQCLREMVLFPLMYPELFQKFNTRPAKGVLFHGPPGTGKTLLARALANECSAIGGRKVSFFMRKGADCLKKWVGESERMLKLLFQQAQKMKPSIIFFDEIDALAPVRSARQDQVHTSVVGTLLAEMDGLEDRGEVVIIGATNRLDAIDPALRRAGRLDRELHFPAPGAAARQAILAIYTRGWPNPPDTHALERMADRTNGYGGSDLKALCSEAVLKALKRVYPQVYESEHALVIDAKNVEVLEEDMVSAMRSLVSAGCRGGIAVARRLPAAAEPLLGSQLDAIATMLHDNYAPDSIDCDESLSGSAILISGPCASSIAGPALCARGSLEGRTARELSAAALHHALAFTPDQALLSILSECRRTEHGCILLARDIEAVCRVVPAAMLAQLWRGGGAGARTLLLATTEGAVEDLPEEIRELFPAHKQCVYHMREPTVAEVLSFLKPVVAEAPLQPPPKEPEKPPPLPRAPPPPPPRPSAAEEARRKRKEDYKLRELRIFLRDICRKLASNRRFYKFTKPVDLEEVTDYLDIVKQPMDLETMMTKVDMHKYNCAKEFLDDVDLICANALEYNPDRTSSDKQIRHEACSLRDHAHALIDVEMDSDFELECQRIAASRDGGDALDPDLPDFIYTASNLPHGLSMSSVTHKEEGTPQNGEKTDCHSSKRKRRRINAWSKGLVAKRPKTNKSFKDSSLVVTDEESKENKPITSTPLPNGSATTSSGSDDDAPLRRPVAADDCDATANHVGDEPAKSTEKPSPTKSSPKKRNSGNEVAHEAEKVLINKTELENVLYKNAKALRGIGLQAILDLHSQLTRLVETYSGQYDRTKLPNEIQAVVARYIHLAKK